MRTLASFGNAAVAVLCTWVVGSVSSAQVNVDLKSPDGALRPYQLKAHPRVWLDGPDGPVTSALRDPDGPGPRKSVKAQGILWDALQRRLDRLQPRSATYLGGNVAALAALGWFMDNNATYKDGTTYRQRALDHINNVDKVWVGLGACDKAVKGCGTAFAPTTSTSYMGSMLSYWAQAYTLMRSEMTVEQRKVFAEKVLNGITKDIGGNCENRLERLPGTAQLYNNGGATYSVSAAAGATWDKSVEGQWIYFKRPDMPFHNGQFLYVTNVDNQELMRVEKPASANFYDRPLHMYRIKPWASGQCGMGYIANHHANTPQYVVAYGVSKTVGAMSASDRILSVATTDWIPKFFPFYLIVGGQVSGEVMTVTKVEGNQLTVSRGDFSTQPRDWPSKTSVLFSSHMGSGDEMGWNNRTLTRQVGHIMAALALADDDPRAIELLKVTLDYWYSNTWFAANNYFTISSTSTTSYGLSRLVPFYLWSIQAMYESTVPALDYRGDWIKRLATDFYFYWSPPWDSKGLINWGIPADNCNSLAGSVEAQCAAPAAFLQALYPGTPEAKYAWHWLNEQGIPKDLGRLAADTGDRILIPLLLYTDSGLPQLDHREALPPHIVANKTDDDARDPTTNLSLVSSKTDWTPQASQLYVIAADDHTDEFPDTGLSDKVVDSYNGDYGIGKQGWLLGQIRPDGYWMRFVGFQNVVDFGPLARTAVRPFADLEVDRKKDDSSHNYLYFRLDLARGYAAAHRVIRAYRHFIHFKTPGKTEHILVYDDYASSLPQRIRGMLHYPNNGEKGEGQTTFDPGMTLVASDNTKAKLLTKIVRVGGAGIRTDLNVVWKNNTASVGSYCSEALPCRAVIGGQTYTYSQPATVEAIPAKTGKAEVYVWLDPADGKLRAAPNNATISCTGGLECGADAPDFPAGVQRLARMSWSGGRVAAGCPGVTAVARGLEFDQCVGGTERHLFLDAGPAATEAEFAVVHKPTTLGDEMEAVSELPNTGPLFGIQIEGKDPKVALIARGGVSYSAMTFETTHEGTAQYLVSGLSAGRYEIRRGEEVLAVDVNVDPAEGALYFESTKGQFTLTRNGDPPPLTPTVPAQLKGKTGEAFLQSLTASGGAPPYQWIVEPSLLPPGIVLSNATGSLEGTPTTAGSYSLTLVVSDSEGRSANTTVEFVVEQGDPNLRILTEYLDEAIAGELYSRTLIAAGGISPFAWSITDGELPGGMELDPATGELRGTPTDLGEYSFTVALQDSAGAVVERVFVLEVVLAS